MWTLECRWPAVVNFENIDMLPRYMIKDNSKIKTNHLLQGISDEKELGGYEKIDIANWRTSGVLKNQPK